MIDLKIPLRPEYISVARLTAAAVAARKDFTYEEIEDLKVAVSEACNALIQSQGASGESIALHFVEESDALDISIEARHGAGSRLLFPDARATGRRGEMADDARALGVFLMQCLVDEVRRIDGGGGIALRLRKKQRERTSGRSPSSPQ